MTRFLVSFVWFWLAATPALAAPPPPRADGVAVLLQKVERALESGEISRYLDLLSLTADRERARIFAATIAGTGVTRAVVRERDRVHLFGTLPGDGFQLLVEAFLERGNDARLATWQLDIRRLGMALRDSLATDEWRISDQELITSFTGLRRLALNPRRQFAARDFVVTGEDLQLTLAEGSVFIAEADGAPTALVLLGRGDMVFTPEPEIEKSQVRIFAGAEVLQSPFEAAYIRSAGFDLDAALAQGVLVERQVDPRDFRRADDVFAVEVAKSFVLDLGDLSSDTWSLLPNRNDLLAEIRTRRFDTLTYALSRKETEDVSLFDRKRRRNISVYASRSKRIALGNSYDENMTADYEAASYDIEASFTPDRTWIEGRTRMTMKVRAPSITSLTFRLADSLAVRSVFTREFGRLLFLRVRNHNSVVVHLPSPVSKGIELTLIVSYAGRLAPQPTDREVLDIGVRQDPAQEEPGPIPAEESYMYSTRSHWYAEAASSGYALATLRLTVPAGFGCVASGYLQSSTPAAQTAADQLPPERRPRVFTFVTDQPVRYLSCLISRLVTVRTQNVRMAEPLFGRFQDRAPGVFNDSVTLSLLAQPRQQARARQWSDRAADIVRFYTSIIGDLPYPSLTVAVVDSELPGGHSPAYVTVLNQPTPGSQKVWRNDPASFDDFPEYFLAHEIAHQWWGQAVGWRNYHEQWLSEGFAQYFAALYAERARGRPVFNSVIRRMRRFAMEGSDQGPVYLGYRIGHVKGDSRLFRAVVYNKGAIVLHTLRRLVGDDAFFRGLRRYYFTWRFRRAGTRDLQRAVEAEAGIPLERFFDRWILGSAVPQVRVTSRTEDGAEGQEAVLRFEQMGEVFDLPVTVTIDYLGRPPVNVPVRLTEQISETRIPLRGGAVRRIDVNRDEFTIGDFIRQLPGTPSASYRR